MKSEDANNPNDSRNEITPVSVDDYATEFLDYIIAVRVVDDLAQAIEHISKYSTGHSECIVTESLFAAEEFQKRIDAAAVYVNASTRFTDGEELRTRSGDRNIHSKASRQRTDGAARTYHNKISDKRKRTDKIIFQDV